MRTPIIDLSLAALACLAMTASAQTPSFAVASVKQSSLAGVGFKEGPRESISHGPDSMTMRATPLKSCIQWAYGVMEYQISGPAWIGTERYDIAAKADTPVEADQLRLMMQTLLAARFHLQLHKETKDLPVYELTVAKNGPKFEKAEGTGESSMRVDGGDLVFRNFSMENLAGKLPGFPFRVDRPVVDRTGLTGIYDFKLHLAGSALEMKLHLEQADAGFIADLIQSQLGLKLLPRKDPVEILVIDSAERVPTEN